MPTVHGIRIMDSNFHPLISIVIPVYNGSNYLSEAIDSALAQTYDHVEVLVINDGSNDDEATEKIALSYGDRIRYFKKKNGGVSSALNLGIQEMRGEYFSWLSHDDKYLPEKIARQIAYLKELGRNDVVLYGNFFFMDKDSRITGKTRFKNIPPNEFRYHLLIDYIANGCTMLIPRQCFGKNAPFREDLRITQDNELWYRMAKDYSFVLMDEPLVAYRITSEQGSVRLKEFNFEKDILYRSWINDLASHRAVRAEEYLFIASRLLGKGLFRPALHAYGKQKEKSSPRDKLKTLFQACRFSRALKRYRQGRHKRRDDIG